MTARFTTTLTAALAALAISTATAVEPNDSPDEPTPLPPAIRSITDNLNGNSGRPDTILGHYNPGFSVLYSFDDNSSTVGNGTASRLVGVPLLSTGSAYFRVTGAPDTLFLKSHEQLGRYKISYDIRDPDGNPVPSKSYFEYEDVTPFELDNFWINPSASPDPGNPNWVGYTVDNIVGPGTGDSLDFFLFTGFAPGEAFTAQLTDIDFSGIVGWYTAPNAAGLEAHSDPLAPVPTISGVANGAGQVLLGVTGFSDLTFIGQHAQVGTYTLSIVPEPSGLAALGIGIACCGGYWIRTRRRQRTAGASR